MDTLIPFSPVLEKYYLPDADDIVTAVKGMFKLRGNLGCLFKR